MELVWSDAGLCPDDYTAVCAFTTGMPWHWTDEPRGEFRFDTDLYRVRFADGVWQVFKLIDPGAA